MAEILYPSGAREWAPVLQRDGGVVIPPGFAVSESCVVSIPGIGAIEVAGATATRVAALERSHTYLAHLREGAPSTLPPRGKGLVPYSAAAWQSFVATMPKTATFQFANYLNDVFSLSRQPMTTDSTQVLLNYEDSANQRTHASWPLPFGLTLQTSLGVAPVGHLCRNALTESLLANPPVLVVRPLADMLLSSLVFMTSFRAVPASDSDLPGALNEILDSGPVPGWSWAQVLDILAWAELDDCLIVTVDQLRGDVDPTVRGRLLVDLLERLCPLRISEHEAEQQWVESARKPNPTKRTEAPSWYGEARRLCRAACTDPRMTLIGERLQEWTGTLTAH
jgi:hypothetical protein